MNDDTCFDITSEGPLPAARPAAPGRSRKRIAVVGASVVASGAALVGGGALLLGPGAATAAPAGHAVRTGRVAITTPTTSAATSAVAKALAVRGAGQAPIGVTVPAGSSVETPTEASDEKAVDVFFAKGYTYDDAVALAKTWNTADAWSAKIKGGTTLEDGGTLPIPPASSAAAPAAPDTEDAAVTEFFAKGYTYDDAVKLSAIWHTVDPYHAKIEGGSKLEAGETLPIAP